MVNAAKNSPAVVLWSIGNEIPDSTSSRSASPIAKRLIADVRVDRHHAARSSWARTSTAACPPPGSPQDQILALLDGIGLNYNTAASVGRAARPLSGQVLLRVRVLLGDLDARRLPGPEQLNTGENFTPGRRATSSYDNNLASWTMSGEYGLKKDRDRR